MGVTHHYIRSDDHLYIVYNRTLHSVHSIGVVVGNLPGYVVVVTNSAVVDVQPVVTTGKSLAIPLVEGISPLVSEEREQGSREPLHGNETAVCRARL